MIRINLVAPERTTKTKTKAAAGPSMPAGALQSYLLLALLVGGALVLCAGAWWLQSNKLRDLDTRIAADEKRMRDLQAIAQQVAQFQQKKAVLENKVLVIEQLRLLQKSPVHMLDEVSKGLPDYVWLTTLDETQGNLKFGGQSNSLAAVADYISALQRSGWFPTVDLATAQEQQSIVNFTLTGAFMDPEVAAKKKAIEDAKAAAAQAAATKPGPGGR
ncbi:MAG TPA: PilN domain-containing protein [Solirubrobacterales bacterium]|nr:PilN domain-containing protein [Solirubrobacterales bacterium]